MKYQLKLPNNKKHTINVTNNELGNKIQEEIDDLIVISKLSNHKVSVINNDNKKNKILKFSITYDHDKTLWLQIREISGEGFSSIVTSSNYKQHINPIYHVNKLPFLLSTIKKIIINGGLK